MDCVTGAVSSGQMPQTCILCNHRRRDGIDRALLAGESIRHIAARFDTSSGALQRHKAEHLRPSLVRRIRQKRTRGQRASARASKRPERQSKARWTKLDGLYGPVRMDGRGSVAARLAGATESGAPEPGTVRTCGRGTAQRWQPSGEHHAREGALSARMPGVQTV